MSETSQLQESIPPELLDETEVFQIRVMDQTGSEHLLETSVKLRNPYDFDLTRFVPNDQHTDLERFFTIACEVIDDAQEREGIDESERIKLVEDFNVDEFQQHGDELIAWKVVKREPGKMDTKATGRPQRRPMHSYDLRFSDRPNKVIIVESMPVDHVIEFTVWSKVASKANKRALWLERLFIDHSWAFTSKGVEKFFWQGRGADTLFTASSQRLYQRPLRFFVRLREFHSVAYPAIRNFEFEVNLSDHT